MKKRMALFLLIGVTAVFCTACESLMPREEDKMIEIVPQLSQVKDVCQLAVIECYYHDVARNTEEDAEGFWLWKKDRHYWIEYDAVVQFGIDVSQVNIVIDDTTVTITLPQAKLLECRIDSSKPFTYTIEDNSAAVSAQNSTQTLVAAQAELRKKAENDAVLISDAQLRAKELLEEYIQNINRFSEKTYTIRWVMQGEESGNA